MLGNVSCAWRTRYGCRHLALEMFEFEVLFVADVSRTKPLVSTMSQLLGFEADGGMELHLETLARRSVAPLCVDAVVVRVGPVVLQLDHLESGGLQAVDV